MPYYFTPTDHDLLKRAIRETAGRMKSAQDEMGRSVTESSETWHDNYGYEEGRRSFSMWSKRLAELQEIDRHAVVRKPAGTSDRVDLASRVTFMQSDSPHLRTVRIGSYINFTNDPETVSYDAPLGRALMGARAGESRQLEIGGQKKRLTVTEIGK